MLAARRSAREALSDMAQQNGRLITALMDAKRQLTAMRDAHAATQRQYEVCVCIAVEMHCTLCISCVVFILLPTHKYNHSQITYE